MWAKGITGIEKVEDLGATPARVNHQTGVIQVSMKHMRILPAEHRKFVLLHEMGHIIAHTDKEEEADAWAFKKYMEMGGSLNASVTALTRILNNDNPQHHWRMYLELERAKKYDREVNGNKNI